LEQSGEANRRREKKNTTKVLPVQEKKSRNYAFWEGELPDRKKGMGSKGACKTAGKEHRA